MRRRGPKAPGGFAPPLAALLALSGCGGSAGHSSPHDASDTVDFAETPDDAADPSDAWDGADADGAADVTGESPTDAADDNGPSANRYAIAAGRLHQCAWRGHDLLCWGQNHAGELGTGEQSDWQGPTRVVGLGAVQHVAVGEQHTCAVDGDGHVWCWGDNTFGQLGDGTMEQRLVPTPVPQLAGIVSLAAGRGHTCALSATGQVFCWGDNCCAQLGTAGDSTLPGPVSGLTDAVELAAGYVHTCVRRRGGRISCWGPNSYGEIGDGTNIVAPRPTDVVGLPSPAVQLVTGPFHGCALLTDQSTLCWGRGMDGTLGDGASVDSLVPRPIVMPAGETAVQIAPAMASCARLATGRVACWGSNTGGALGDGTVVPSRAVPGLTAAVDDAVDVAGLCAVRATGAVACWGPNGFGQVADGTRVDRNVPTAVVGLP